MNRLRLVSDFTARLLAAFTAALVANPFACVPAFMLLFGGWTIYRLMSGILVILAGVAVGFLVADVVPFSQGEAVLIYRLMIVFSVSLAAWALLNRTRKAALFLWTVFFFLAVATSYPETATVDYSSLKLGFVSHVLAVAGLRGALLAAAAGLAAALIEKQGVILLTSAGGAWIFFLVGADAPLSGTLFGIGVIFQFLAASAAPRLTGFFKRFPRPFRPRE